MIRDDEPVLDSESADEPDGSKEAYPLAEQVRRLVQAQPFAVLCTHGPDHAYGSLVAFAFTPDLCSAVFCTPRATRKYRLLTDHDRVALVIDDRPEFQTNMMEVEAITATGLAREVTAEPLLSTCRELMVARHPQMKTFVMAESCAVFQIEIFRYFHVTRFQEVRQWTPNPA